MFVYFKCGTIVKRIPGVTLEDCYKPKVGAVTEERIECALWYKVLVLDSVLVDCEQRTVYWTINSLPEEGSIHNCPDGQLDATEVLNFFNRKETLFEDGPVYDFDPTVDELFDTALHIFDSLCPEVIDAEGNVPTYLNLMRMLHVYILPKIKFRKGDEEHIRLLLQEIEQEHEKVEKNIKFKDNSKKNIENSLRKQRERFLREGNFQSSQYISTLEKGFLRVFLEHLEKDIKQLNTILVNVQAEISPRRDTASGDDLKKLTELRTSREDVNASLNSAITAREEIKNSIIRRQHKRQSKRRKSQVTITTNHVVYLEITKRQQAASQEIRELISIKIKMSSVREAVMLTLQEIQTDGESFGYNCKKGSFEIETDLFDPTKKPEEWATLGERVKVYLQIKQAGFRAKYEKFCTMMKQKCQHLLDEAKLFIAIDSDESTVPVSPTTARFISEIGRESVGRRTGPSISFPTYSSRWSMGSISKSHCEALCKQVTEHMDKTATEIAVEIQQEQNARRDSKDHDRKRVLRSFHSKVYICYEEHVSSELMPVLCNLYEKSYWGQCENLYRWMSNTCVSACGYGEDRICILLQGSSQNSSSEESSREASDEIASTEAEVKPDKLASMRVRSMTLEQLYAVSDGMDESLPDFFQGALGFDTDPAATNGQFVENRDETSVKRPFNSSLFHSMVHSPIPEGSEASERSSSPFEVVDISPDVKLTRIPEDGANDVSHPSDLQKSNNIEKVQNVEKVQMRHKKSANAKLSSELMPNKERFYKEFKEFTSIIREEDQERKLFGKMRHLTQAMQFISDQLTRLRKENGCGSQPCSDDFIDVIILLLYGLDFQDLLKLYAHINIMIHLVPDFMQGNAHEYALVTFSAAYQHLFEQMVLQTSVTSNVDKKD